MSTIRRIITIILVVILIASTARIVIWKFTAFDDGGADSFVLLSDGFTDIKITDEESALTAIEDASETLGLKNVKRELKCDRINTINGRTYYRFQQICSGLPVFGKYVTIVADSKGNALAVSGNTSPITTPSSLEPTASPEEIIGFIEEYVLENFGCQDRSLISVAPFNSDALAIYHSNSKSELVYTIPVCFSSDLDPGYFEIMVNAKTGDILHATPTLYSAIGYTASDTERDNGFPVFKSDEGYYLWDTDDNFYVLNLDNQKSSYSLENLWGKPLLNEEGNTYTISQWGKGKFVVSDNEIFGDTQEEKDKDYEAGARLLLQAKAATNFFKNLGFFNDTWMFLYYRDGWSNGNNSLGGMIPNSNLGVISMGTNTGVDLTDVVCHEFTHYVSVRIVGGFLGNEALSINEGISDTFGEIMEAQIDNQKIDWQMGPYRNIKEPGDEFITDYVDYTDGMNRYFASTLISHAAYLMWNGIDGSGDFEPLSLNELANLYYETLYALPPDCTFQQFGALIRNTAKYQDLSTEKRLCVSAAMFQVGIASSSMPVSKDCVSVETYDINGLEYDDYTLYVSNGNRTSKYRGADARAQGLSFPEPGKYELRIVDNANANNETVIHVIAVERGGTEKLSVFSHCGVLKLNTPFRIDIENSKEEPDITLLSNNPFESHRDQMELHEYEITGGIRETEGKYSDYVNLPDFPVIVELTDDFGHNGIMTRLTIGKYVNNNGYEYVAAIFNLPNGDNHNIAFSLGKSWDGESMCCYIFHGTDTDYLVTERLIPTSSAIDKNTYYIGETETGTRTENIQIINLNNFSKLEYKFEYIMGFDAYSICEEDSSRENFRQFLYCQDGEYNDDYMVYEIETLYDSYDDAINHIREKLSAYGLESRISGGNPAHIEEDKVILLFTEYRKGLHQNIPLNDISNLELHDTMILGINPLLSPDTQEKTFQYNDTSEESLRNNSPISIAGAWDSTDGETRLIFNANGSVAIINLKEGKSVRGSFIIDENSMRITANLRETNIPFSYTDDALTIGKKTFHLIDQALINQLVGTWESDNGIIYFGEDNYMWSYNHEGKPIGKSFYAILNKSEIEISIDHNDIRTIPYSVDGTCLNLGGALLYKK